ncbi:lipase secretion chaperone [Salinisphaera sp. Q1T1-3]|uniref:lipase secretion chaperone n=1 Tax=Salinisphaera sp. Q1T1-3 TaxID=2321229 RepID=UPI0013140BE4|nr:lipase secretion chaperone [Salinisphaera sp. Q1T1-3]
MSAVSRSSPSTVIEVSFSDTLPPQFQGTAVDGAITVDAKGGLEPSRAVRRLFDYFISGAGAYDGDDQAAAVRETIGRYARSQGVPDRARDQLLALYDRYMALKQRVVDHSAVLAYSDLETRLNRLSEIRQAELGPTAAQAFYGESNEAVRDALARRRGVQGVEDDPVLAKATTPVRLATRVSKARASGASPARIREMRAQALGPDAVDRLEALDIRRAAWAQHYDAYARERDAIIDSAMAEGDQSRALTDLRARHFTSEPERRRAAALDRLAQTQSISSTR